MEVVINSKRVVLRDKIPAKLGWDIVVTKSAVLQKEWAQVEFGDLALLLTVAIESWEMEGDPSDAASYAELDLLREFIPLTTELGKWLNERFQQPKN